MKNLYTKWFPVIIMLGTPFFLNAQTIFSNTLDSDYPYDVDLAESAIATQDGGALVAGRVFNPSTGWNPSAALAFKLDADGNPLWWYGLDESKPVGVNKHKVQFYGVTEDASGDCVFGGMNANKNYQKVGSQGLLAKFTSGGSLLWYKKYNIQKSHEPGMNIFDVAQLPNGKYVATGYIGYGWSTGNGDCLWFQTDANGENPVARGFPFAKSIQGVRIVPQADNSVVIAWFGRHHFPDIGSSYFPGFARIDANGNLTLQRWVILDYSAILNDFIRTSDGGYAAVGNGDSEAYLLKLDAELKAQWIKSWPIASQSTLVPSLNSIIELDNGNYYLSGADYQGAFSYQNIILITDANGNILSSRLVNNSGYNGDNVQQSIALPDGRILSIGNINHNPGLDTTSDISVFHDGPSGITSCPATDIALEATLSGILKTKDEGNFNGNSYTLIVESKNPTVNTVYEESLLCSPVKVESATPINAYQVFPNPADEYITFSIPPSQTNNLYKCEIMDVMGKVMLLSTVSDGQSTLLIKDFPPGVYTFRLSSAGTLATIGRFVKQ